MNADYTTSILVLAAAGTTFAKVLVDLVKMAAPAAPGWSLPLLALLFGVGVVALLMLANGQPLTQASAATVILSGILSAGSAVGVTELGRRADDARGS